MKWKEKLNSFTALVDRNPPFYHHLLILFPILYAAALYPNWDQLRWVFCPMLIALLVTTLLFFILSRFIRDSHQSSFLTLYLLIPAVYLGPQTILPFRLNIYHQTAAMQWLMLAIWAVAFFFLATRWAGEKIRFRRFTFFLNLIGIIWIAGPLSAIPKYYLKSVINPQVGFNQPLEANTLEGSPLPENQPDIYYIILDGYARADVLKETYGYDNSAFIAALRERGFYLADDSTSNYYRTHLSVASSLNLDYLSKLSSTPPTAVGQFEYTLIENNRLTKFLNQRGYQIISFETGLPHTSVLRSDMRLGNEKQTMSPFEQRISGYTILGLFDLEKPGDTQTSEEKRLADFDRHRNRILFEFAELSRMPERESPKFVFAHILVPHPPFVFDANGKPVYPDGDFHIWDANDYQGTDSEYLRGYTDQLTYINRHVLETIDAILEKSSTAPIIILQSDHGPGLMFDFSSLEKSCIKERFSILNAYYLPGDLDEQPHQSISPVNSFRMILDGYFDTTLGLLEDRSYYSVFTDEHNFTDVSELLDTACIPKD